MYVRRRLVVLVCVQSALRVTTPSVLLDGHTWLVLELSHGGMGSPFDGCCRRYYDQQVCAELKWKYRQSSSGNISTRSFAVWLSFFSFNIAVSLLQKTGSSSHTPVGRTGGVKSEAFTSLILCRSYANSSLVHARYKYQCFHQAKGHKINNIS